jgi:hypothetical protein
MDPTSIANPTGEAPAPFGAEREFRTDFSRDSVDYAEVLSGGPPKDGIPAVDEPHFQSIAQADSRLEPQEPVILFQSGGDARAYPLQILVWHEIVNDVVAGEPVLITFCPLCNTAIAFARTVNGRVLDFGTTGHIRPYGQNPYVGYDDINNTPFAYWGTATPDRLAPMARVLSLDLGGEVVAFAYDTLETERAINDVVGGEAVVVFWAPGTASALDNVALAAGRDMGTAAAYSRKVNGRVLKFTFDGSALVDQDTGTRWDILGQAIEGELAGEHLTPLVAINHFWFSWVAFKPETWVYRP